MFLVQYTCKYFEFFFCVWCLNECAFLLKIKKNYDHKTNVINSHFYLLKILCKSFLGMKKKKSWDSFTNSIIYILYWIGILGCCAVEFFWLKIMSTQYYICFLIVQNMQGIFSWYYIYVYEIWRFLHFLYADVCELLLLLLKKILVYFMYITKNKEHIFLSEYHLCECCIPKHIKKGYD